MSRTGGDLNESIIRPLSRPGRQVSTFQAPPRLLQVARVGNSKCRGRKIEVTLKTSKCVTVCVCVCVCVCVDSGADLFEYFYFWLQTKFLFREIFEKWRRISPKFEICVERDGHRLNRQIETNWSASHCAVGK